MKRTLRSPSRTTKFRLGTCGERTNLCTSVRFPVVFTTGVLLVPNNIFPRSDVTHFNTVLAKLGRAAGVRASGSYMYAIRGVHHFVRVVISDDLAERVVHLLLCRYDRSRKLMTEASTSILVVCVCFRSLPHFIFLAITEFRWPNLN